MPRGEVKKSNQFHDTFVAAYGDRWKQLKEAMIKPSPKVALWNRHCKIPKPTAGDESGLVETVLASGLSVFRHADPEVIELPQPDRDEFGVPAYYLMDFASILVVEALRVEPFSKVLDLCAAPGGKSVALSQYLAVSAELTSNEKDAERCKRLKRVLQEHIPASAHNVVVSQKDGVTWHMQSHFDRVLVDAPCSSERHLMHQPEGLAKWTLTSTKEQAAVQTSLLLRGLETVKVGGIVVYSTCSISPIENDGVVEAALKRCRVGVEVVPDSTLPGGEPTKAGGTMLLPDTAAGIGPMYCCVLRRTSERRPESGSDSDDDEADGEDE